MMVWNSLIYVGFKALKLKIKELCGVFVSLLLITTHSRYPWRLRNMLNVFHINVSFQAYFTYLFHHPSCLVFSVSTSPLGWEWGLGVRGRCWHGGGSERIWLSGDCWGRRGSRRGSEFWRRDRVGWESWGIFKPVWFSLFEQMWTQLLFASDQQ